MVGQAIPIICAVVPLFRGTQVAAYAGSVPRGPPARASITAISAMMMMTRVVRRPPLRQVDSDVLFMARPSRYALVPVHNSFVADEGRHSIAWDPCRGISGNT